MSESTASARASEPGRYLTFRLDGEIYGVPILDIREIIEVQEISPVPLSSPWVRGVINLRGRVLPVVDPKIRFGLEPVVPSDLTVIIVLQANGGRPFGMLVDEVLEVQRPVVSDVAEPPDLATDHQEFLAGFGRVRDQLVFLLDPSSLHVH